MITDCNLKVRFATKELARFVIIDNRLTNCTAYLCSSCGGWHIGKINPIAEWKKKERNKLQKKEKGKK